MPAYGSMIAYSPRYGVFISPVFPTPIVYPLWIKRYPVEKRLFWITLWKTGRIGTFSPQVFTGFCRDKRETLRFYPQKKGVYPQI
jgi:hypothetical protein